MLNLEIKTTQVVTTDDLEIYCGELPLVFEAVGNINRALNDDLLSWAEAKYPPQRAVQFVPRLFLSVSQNGSSFPLNTVEAAEGLRQAVGDELLVDLVEGFWNYRYRFFKKKRFVSANLSAESNTGSESELTP